MLPQRPRRRWRRTMTPILDPAWWDTDGPQTLCTGLLRFAGVLVGCMVALRLLRVTW